MCRLLVQSFVGNIKIFAGSVCKKGKRLVIHLNNPNSTKYMDELKKEISLFQVQFFAWKNEVNRHTEALDKQYADLLSGLKKAVETIVSLNERVKLQRVIWTEKDVEDISTRLNKLEKQQLIPAKKPFWKLRP